MHLNNKIFILSPLGGEKLLKKIINIKNNLIKCGYSVIGDTFTLDKFVPTRLLYYQKQFIVMTLIKDCDYIYIMPVYESNKYNKIIYDMAKNNNIRILSKKDFLKTK